MEYICTYVTQFHGVKSYMEVAGTIRPRPAFRLTGIYRRVWERGMDDQLAWRLPSVS